MGYFNIDKDPIYDVEGSSQTKGVEFSSLVDWFSCTYDLNAWHPGNDMITIFF